MSRRYVEPGPGNWVLISNVSDGDVACLRVERIEDAHGGRVAWLSDGSAWAVETGAPLHRRWIGHALWSADLSMVIDEYHRKIDDVGNDLDTWARLLAVLLKSNWRCETYSEPTIKAAFRKYLDESARPPRSEEDFQNSWTLFYRGALRGESV